MDFWGLLIMDTKIKLSTGKEIELTEEERIELANYFLGNLYPLYITTTYPQPQILPRTYDVPKFVPMC